MKGVAINNKILFSVLLLIIIFVCAAVVVLHFKGSAQSSIENLQALYITSSDATLKAVYKFENRWSDAKIRFEYKMENSSDNWDFTDWRGLYENGILYEDIHNLTLTTRYKFKAVIQHGSDEISSNVYSFKTYAIPLTYEAYGTVDYTIDGDTVRVNLTWVNPSTVGVYAPSTQSVRFSGGVDAPELHLPTGPPDEGAEEAKSFVRDNFCPYKAEVFLDLDNKSDTPYHDINGRLLGVVYVKENGKWINVNAEMLRWGLKTYPYHDWLAYSYFTTEFNSQQWLENDYPYIPS
jgi:endonuclease YncB( thermonuclease family)